MSRYISDIFKRMLKKATETNNILLADDPRVYKLATFIFSVGIFVAGTINLSSKVNETIADLKLLGSRIDSKFDVFDAKIDSKFTANDTKMDAKFSSMDAKFSSMDAKFTAIDAKMDKQFSTIMAFIAVGRLPGGFSEKIEAAPSPDAVSSP